MSELGAQLEISSTTTGWKLSGEIDAHTAPLLATAMADLPTGDVTVDVADVSFMDSSGLKVLLATRKRVQLVGGQLALAAPGRSVRKVLTVTGLDQAFPVSDTVDAALAAVAADAPQAAAE